MITILKIMEMNMMLSTPHRPDEDIDLYCVSVYQNAGIDEAFIMVAFMEHTFFKRSK